MLGCLVCTLSSLDRWVSSVASSPSSWVRSDYCGLRSRDRRDILRLCGSKAYESISWVTMDTLDFGSHQVPPRRCVFLLRPWNRSETVNSMFARIANSVSASILLILAAVVLVALANSSIQKHRESFLLAQAVVMNAAICSGSKPVISMVSIGVSGEGAIALPINC